MSVDARLLAADPDSGRLFDEGAEFEAYGTEIFAFPTIWGPWADGSLTVGITKYAVVLGLVVVLVLGFWAVSLRRAGLVPNRWQSLGEMAIFFVRDQISRPTMGEKGDRYLPFLTSLFFFILFMNLMGVIPFVQLPVTSSFAIPVGLAAMAYILYNAIGIRKMGFFGHFKNQLLPEGAPLWISPLLIPVEFLSNFVFRPFTHAVRLFATMFAGHLMLAIIAAGGWYMFNPWSGPLFGTISVLLSGGTVIAFLAFTLLEIVIMILQAFVFTLLTSLYIGQAQESH